MRLGQTVMTRNIAERMAKNEKFAKQINNSFGLYMKKDWGCVPECDAALYDERSEEETGGIMGAYETCEGRIWIMTEYDRSVTTILFPDDY